MPQYMLSVHTATGEPREPMTDEQQRAGFARIAGIEADMEAAEAFVFSARLGEPSEAKVVRRGPGKPKTTDGPFAETKEQIGGFYLIEAPTIERRPGLGIARQRSDRRADRGPAASRQPRPLTRVASSCREQPP